MELDAFSLGKQFVHVADTRIAYRDDGDGPPLLLLHGCPFSSFVWRKVIPHLLAENRCLAPDLLGTGDTETPDGADWSLPAQETMIIGFLDALGIERVSMVGHDHGGAVAQLLAARSRNWGDSGPELDVGADPYSVLAERAPRDRNHSITLSCRVP